MFFWADSDLRDYLHSVEKTVPQCVSGESIYRRQHLFKYTNRSTYVVYIVGRHTDVLQLCSIKTSCFDKVKVKSLCFDPSFGMVHVQLITPSKLTKNP